VSETGLLLVNLGTPDAPETAAVRRYLREFLGDPRVLTMPAPLRWLLLYLIILPFRSPRSAHAYQAIWTEEGSPLLVHGRALRERLQERLGEGVRVELAMRYGTPSIRAGLERLKEAGITRVVAAPLYPQYASSTYGSTEEALRAVADALGGLTLELVPPFYDHPAFLDAQAALAKPVLEALDPQKVVLSFHGLPESHLRKGDPTGSHCLTQADCCAAVGEANRDCYRAQCYATARGIVERLGLAEDQWVVTFQSRLGPTAWIQPYTDATLDELVASGTRRVAVPSPAFVADCLETLEELGLQARENFEARGGEALRLVPSLNAEPPWVEALAQIVSAPLGLPPS
jgi:ferrochelatase